jgi:hypothetical protein
MNTLPRESVHRDPRFSPLLFPFLFPEEIEREREVTPKHARPSIIFFLFPWSGLCLGVWRCSHFSLKKSGTLARYKIWLASSLSIKSLLLASQSCTLPFISFFFLGKREIEEEVNQARALTYSTKKENCAVVNSLWGAWFVWIAFKAGSRPLLTAAWFSTTCFFIPFQAA